MKQWFLGADLWKSRFGVMTATCFLTMIWFVVDWCMGTTFRAMSIWELWVNNILATLVLMLPFMISRKVWVQIVWLALVDMLLEANLMYSRTYLTGIPVESYFLVNNLKDFTSSVTDSLRWRDIVFPLILVAGSVMASRMPREKFIPGLWPRYISLVLIPAIVSMAANIAHGGFYKSYDQYRNHAYKNSCTVPVYTVLGHIIYTGMESKMLATPEKEQEIITWLADQKRLAPAVTLPDGANPKKNLVIILLESFETWPIETKIDGKEITPYLNNLLKDSTTFYAPYALTQVDAGRSIDGQLILTAGLLPTKGAVYSNRFPTSTYLTLNKALKENRGAMSIMFTVDQLTIWNTGVVAQSFGYDRILERSVWKNDENFGTSRKLSDGSFFRQSVQKIKDENLWPAGQPRMLTFVSYSGHNPFILPDNLRDPNFDLRGKGYHPTAENFITMAHYTDSQIHTLIDYFRSRPDWNQTMVLITGDHEGLAAQRAEILESNLKGKEIISEGQFTPFIVVNAPVGMRYEEVFGQVDIYPTLLTMLGLEHYVWQGIGQSLFSQDKIPAAISSMTGKMAGDTTGIAPERLNHWKQARTISDGIIRLDYLKKYEAR